jgi:hypothetical protein
MARGGGSTRSRGGSGRGTEAATTTIRSLWAVIAGKSAVVKKLAPEAEDEVC